MKLFFDFTGYKNSLASSAFFSIKLLTLSTNEIKQQLTEGIENIDENDFLLTIKELIDRKYSPSAISALTSQQKQRIVESEQQIENGDYLTDDEVNKLIDRWLKNSVFHGNKSN